MPAVVGGEIPSRRQVGIARPTHNMYKHSHVVSRVVPKRNRKLPESPSRPREDSHVGKYHICHRIPIFKPCIQHINSQTVRQAISSSVRLVAQYCSIN